MSDVVVDLPDLRRAAPGVEVIDALDLAVNGVVAVGGKVGISAPAEEEQGARRDQRADDGEVPQVRVVEVDTVALSGGDPVSGLGGECVGRQARNRHRHPLVHGGGEPGGGSAARYPGHPDPPRVDLRARLQIIDRPHGVPHLDARRSVAERQPVPDVQVVDAVMDPRDLAELERIEDQADVAVGGEPGRAVLIVRLRSQGVGGVAADIEDRRERPGAARREIQVRRDVETGQALEDQLLDPVVGTGQRSGDLRLQRRPLRERVEPEHVQQLAAECGTLPLPLLQRADVAQAAFRERGRGALQVLDDHFLPSHRAVLSVRGDRAKGGHSECNSNEGSSHGAPRNRRRSRRSPSYCRGSRGGACRRFGRMPLS